mmetsp:Transcript_95236/g.168621  ORF Transcript_95236/g.168621 Transcript_95236/m.168621 type:complete len:215 (+) Transcript_95236:91-735(+)
MWLERCCTVTASGRSPTLKFASAEEKNAAGEKALLCLQSGKLEEARTLLSGPVDVTVKGPGGISLLHAAACVGDSQACEQLLKLGPQLAKASDDQGATALHHLASSRPAGGKEVCRVLIRFRVDDTLRDCNGQTALDLAGAAGGDQDVFQILEFRRINTQPRDLSGPPPGGQLVAEAKDFLEKRRSAKTAGVQVDPPPLPLEFRGHGGAALRRA